MTGATDLKPIAVALGDPAGVGPEVVAGAWAARRQSSLSTFFAVGDMASIAAVSDVPVRRIDDPADAIGCFDDALPCLHVENGGAVTPGEPSMEGAHVALQSLELSIGITRSGAASALVTSPVSKAQLYGVGFTHPGQTEFIAERCGIAPSLAVMMLAGPSLKVVPITVHVPLRKVFDMLSIDMIRERTVATVRGLQRNFGIESPRLAIAGINPHAGEDGALGSEEKEFIEPAVAALRDMGIDIVGPLPADGMFHESARAAYDAALCLYHDQALIPIKALHFDDGVNTTLGLPIVRTSPDHGTAFGIAGKGIARPGATIAAIRMAAQCARHRMAG